MDTFTEDTVIVIDDVDAPIDFRPRNSMYYKFRFRDTQATTVWKLAAFEIHGELAGRRPR
jgi:hypothetical protein